MKPGSLNTSRVVPTWMRWMIVGPVLACGTGDNLPGDANPTGDAIRQLDAMGPRADATPNPRDAAVDAPGPDAAIPDAAPDAAIPDAAPDAAIADAAPDAAVDAAPDATVDAAPDASVDAMDLDAGVFTEPDYDFLSETGLYQDIENKVLATDVVEFEPEFKLWSDDADKLRWISLPAGQTIDTSNMDHWQFPVGTKIWKQFTHEVGANTVLLETRLTEIWGPAANQIYQASFVWNVNDTDAAFSRFGATNVKGTDHDVPATDQCIRCHRGETSKVLGFQAVQLSHSGTPNIDDFEALGYFSDAPDPGGYPVPGNATERNAIGYMHANCGHCHNDSNAAVAANACFGLPQLQLWVKTDDEMVFDTYAYLMTVDQDLVYWLSPAEGNEGGFTQRIVRGDPDSSAIYYRMSARHAGQAPPFDDDQQMPPIFTDVADPDGLAAVEAWILSL